MKVPLREPVSVSITWSLSDDASSRAWCPEMKRSSGKFMVLPSRPSDSALPSAVIVRPRPPPATGSVSGHDGAVGVVHKTGIGGNGESGGNGGDGGTVGGEVLGAGGNNSGLVSGDDSAVGVGNKTAESVVVGVGTSVVAVVVVVVASEVGVVKAVVAVEAVVGKTVGISSLGGKVSGLGGLDLRGLGGGNGTVGVGDELGAGSSHASEENLKCSIVIVSN